MRETLWTFLVCGALILNGGMVHAAGPHPIARPFDSAHDMSELSYPAERDSTRIPTDHLDLGSEHILDQQCHNGGFGWPHATCAATVHSITGPILLGVLGAYSFTQDATQLVGAVNGGAFELAYQYPNGEARFPTFTPVFLRELASASDNTTFSSHVTTGLFDELAAGTYSPDDFDTAGWITNIEDGRNGAFVNLRSWEFHTLIPTAHALGQTGQADLFEQAVLDGLNTLDNTDPDNVFSDVVGLAGAVRGLAYARRYAFPPIAAPLHAGVDGIGDLEDLAAYLASLQNPDGSWDWHSGLVAPTTDDEDVQTTAYALMALLEVDVMTATDYRMATQGARDWLVSQQLPDGGFPEWPGGPENTEVEGEALRAIAAFDATIFVDGFETGNTDLWDAVAP